MTNGNLIKAINVVLCLLSASALWAETIAVENESRLGEWVFLVFCALLILSQVVLALRFLFGSSKKETNDLLRKTFRKRLAH